MKRWCTVMMLWGTVTHGNVIQKWLQGVMAQAWIREVISRPKHDEQWHAHIAERREKFIDEHKAHIHTLVTTDNRTLSALWVEREQARFTIIVCHGHHMVKENMFKFVQLFPHENLLLFDFRSCGQSDGDVIALGTDEKYDVLAAVAFVRSHERACRTPIIGFSLSMGCAPLISAAVETRFFSGLILDGAFSSLQKLFSQTFQHTTNIPWQIAYPFVPMFFSRYANIDVSHINPGDIIEHIGVPVLLIHSESDVVTPVDHARHLYEKAREPKQLWLVKDSKHGYIVNDLTQEYTHRIERFFQQCASYSHTINHSDS